MQSISRAQHAFHSCRFSTVIHVTPRCSLVLNARPQYAPSKQTPATQIGARNSHDLANNNDQLSASRHDKRQRLSAFWAPTGGREATGDAKDDSHSFLIRAGFLRQAHAGLFQLLPLGLRVQEKLERLLDKHMTHLGASKVALSTLSSQDLWRKSGRMGDNGASSPEIFQIQDRKEAKYILSPTHEEEITNLVGSTVKSYKELPLRLYQITRKYRDEARPRQGLLRTREFLMKDLYTFDSSSESALETYNSVRKVYSSFFDEFKVPYLVAEAASGEMGGDLSHEYHFPTSRGEDSIVSCNSCDYVANEELAESGVSSLVKLIPLEDLDSHGVKFEEDLHALLHFANDSNRFESPDGLYRQWFGYLKGDDDSIVQVIYPTKKGLLAAGIEASEEPQINPSAVQGLFDLDLSIENPLGDPKTASKVYRIYDRTITPPSGRLPWIVKGYYPVADAGNISANLLNEPYSYIFNGRPPLKVLEVEPNPHKLDPEPSLLKVANGDRCARCEDGQLRVETAVELGHTFYLGTRYTEPLKATIAMDPSQKVTHASAKDEDGLPSGQAFMQMGCHGIGVSRLIAAVADALADSRGLNWPRVMAPFEAVIVPAKAVGADTQAEVYDVLTAPSEPDRLSLDAILDDRQREFGWKLKDADMIGYPIIVVIGRGWKEGRTCEVQCRRLGIKQEVHVEALRHFVTDLLERL